MITITNGILTAEISETGAQLSRLATASNEYLWDGNPDIWPKHAPVLFPFVGRLPNQEYQFKEKTYGPMPIHGFVPTSRFILESHEGSACTMLLVVTPDIRSLYPFDFEFRVRYELEDTTLKVRYLVTNKGETAMFYGMGSHPGFNVPMKDGLRFEDYYVEFPDAGDVVRRTFTDDCHDSGVDIPFPLDGKRLHLRHDLFDKDAICLGNTGNTVTIKTDKDSRSVTVCYPDTPWCAIWHKVKMEVPFLCIEPWFSLPGHPGMNDIEKRDDFFRLESGKSNCHRLYITINGDTSL